MFTSFRKNLGVFRTVAGMLLAAVVVTFGSTGTAVAAGSRNVDFAVPPWPGEIVKAAVARQLLDAIGYNVKVLNLEVAVAMKGIASGDADVDMAVWHPANDPVVGPLLKSGKVDQVAINIPDAKYGMGVPDYVWDAGVHSIGDLHKYAGKFGHKIYGIESGGAGNLLVSKAIQSNEYDLGAFHLVSSSTMGMMSQVTDSIHRHQWIVFLAWRPHWMNVVFKIKYLRDPKLMWGKSSSVATIVNPEFSRTHPNVTRFLKQMYVGAKTQSEWIYKYGYKKVPLDQVASNWIAANTGTVREWLQGVTTADRSGPAFEAVHALSGS